MKIRYYKINKLAEDFKVGKNKVVHLPERTIIRVRPPHNIKQYNKEIRKGAKQRKISDGKNIVQ